MGKPMKILFAGVILVILLFVFLDSWQLMNLRDQVEDLEARVEIFEKDSDSFLELMKEMNEQLDFFIYKAREDERNREKRWAQSAKYGEAVSIYYAQSLLARIDPANHGESAFIEVTKAMEFDPALSAMWASVIAGGSTFGDFDIVITGMFYASLAKAMRSVPEVGGKS